LCGKLPGAGLDFGLGLCALARRELQSARPSAAVHC
jgi:hypothetical protein